MGTPCAVIKSLRQLSLMHFQMPAVLCSLCFSPHNEPLLPRFVHRFDPGIQMRSYLDWMMATMQLTLIIRYSLLSIFQSFCIIMEYPVLILLALFGHCLGSALKHWHVAVAGSVGAEEKQPASGWPEFSQELLQCFLFAQVRFMPSSSMTSCYYILRTQL